MSDGFDEVYVDTRRQLRGVAESLIAGPQYRTAGTIRPAVRPDGFAGVTDGVYEIVDPLPTDGALDIAHDVDALTAHIADFFQRGRREL